MQGSSNKEWLVKSSGEIKGPYTFEEIAQGIISKEFVLVDEVSKSFHRWKYLREEVAFERVINEFKNREYSKNEKTFTNSETDTLTEEMSGKVLKFGGESLVSNIKEHLKGNEEARAAQIRAREEEKVREEKIKNYALAEDLKKESAKKHGFFRYLILFAVIGAAAFIYLNQKREKALSYDDLLKLAYENVNYGQFEEAKTYLDKALAVNGTNEELRYLSSYVSIELDDNLVAKRLLTDLSKSTQNTKLKHQIYNLLGVLSLKSFELDEAKKHLDVALSTDKKYVPALYNMGVVNFLKNEPDLAYQNFSLSLISGGLDGNILLAMVEMNAKNINENREDADRKRQAQDILTMIARQSQNMQAYKQELKIGAAYLQFILGEKTGMEKFIEEALNVDPFLTSDHVPDISYYKGLVTWDRMSMWIKKMKDAYPKNGDLETLYAYVLFRGSEKLKGKDILEGLLKSDYSNTSNQILLSYALMELKRDEEAKATLAPIMHHRDKSLSFVMMGRICLEKKDYPCADLNYNEALRIDKESISAKAGLAQTYYELKDTKKAKELALEVYKTSATYKPILNLRKKLDFIQ